MLEMADLSAGGRRDWESYTRRTGESGINPSHASHNFFRLVLSLLHIPKNSDIFNSLDEKYLVFTEKQ